MARAPDLDELDLAALVVRIMRTSDDCGIATAYASGVGLGRTGVMFFKPEVASSTPEALYEAMRYLWSAARRNGVRIRTVHAVTGRAALRCGFIQRNYGVIHRNALAMPGTRLIEGHPWAVERPLPTLGALRLRRTGIGAAALSAYWRAGAADVRKLGTDCYGLPIILAGRFYVLINGFYPYQLEQYSAHGARLVIFTFDAARPLSELKSTLQGDADPAVASHGSVRAFLHRMSRRRGAPEIWTSQNGLHMSATEAEGASELQTFVRCFHRALR